MRIGINTGVAIVGNVGSKKRMQYSTIGSSVNLSSRIQDLSLGGQILISEYTYKEVAKDIDIKKVDHSTINRWVIHYAPQLEESFRKRYKRPVGISWHMDQ